MSEIDSFPYRWRETWTFHPFPIGRECWLRWVSDEKSEVEGPFPALGIYVLLPSREGDAPKEEFVTGKQGSQFLARAIGEPPYFEWGHAFNEVPEYPTTYVLLAMPPNSGWEFNAFPLNEERVQVWWSPPEIEGGD